MDKTAKNFWVKIKEIKEKRRGPKRKKEREIDNRFLGVEIKLGRT